MSKESSVIQLDNQYIKDEATRKRFEAEEERKRHRFMGWLLFFLILLFILPTNGMVKSYGNLKEQKKEISKLKKEYEEIQIEVTKKKDLAASLKDEDFVAKYARAKYYYSFDGETIYLLPDLIPQ